MYTEDRSEERRLTLVFILAVALVAIVWRVVPRYLGLGFDFPWNVTPVGALMLFAGSRLRSRHAWLLPLAVMFVSDLLLLVPLGDAGYQTFAWRTPVIYGSFMLYLAVGRMIRQGELSPLSIGWVALLGSVQFFVLTNLATWPTLYPLTLDGLTTCYVTAIPFYKNTLIGDMMFSAIIFAAHAALLHVAAIKKARQPA